MESTFIYMYNTVIQCFIVLHRDGVRESDVMSKQFMVEEAGRATLTDTSTDCYSTEEYTSFFETSDIDTDTTFKSSSSASTLKNKRKPKKVNLRVRMNQVDHCPK